MIPEKVTEVKSGRRRAGKTSEEIFTKRKRNLASVKSIKQFYYLMLFIMLMQKSMMYCLTCRTMVSRS